MSEAEARRGPGRPRKNPEAAVDERRESREVPTRVPFGGLNYRLEVVNKDPDYFYYWFNDRGDTIERALQAGFQFVSRREVKRVVPEELTNRDVNGGNQSIADDVRVFGGRDEYGRDFQMVLMRQPMEYHLQDQKAKDAKVDEIDLAIRRQASKNSSVATKYGDMTMSVRSEE